MKLICFSVKANVKKKVTSTEGWTCFVSLCATFKKKVVSTVLSQASCDLAQSFLKTEFQVKVFLESQQAWFCNK